MLTVLICDLRNSALNVALGQLIIAGAVCVPRKKTFYYKKTNKHGKVGFGTGFSPQTGVQDIQTNSLEPRGLVLHSKQREGKQKCLGIAVLREEVMLGVVATSPTSLWGNLVNWLTNKIIPNICSKFYTSRNFRYQRFHSFISSVVFATPHLVAKKLSWSACTTPSAITWVQQPLEPSSLQCLGHNPCWAGASGSVSGVNNMCFPWK